MICDEYQTNTKQMDKQQVPDAPSNLTGTASNAQVNLSWDAPTSNGGRDISNYNVISSPAGGTVTINSATRTATVTGLTNGTIYTFTVTATNVAGTSAVSNSIQLTPDFTELNYEEVSIIISNFSMSDFRKWYKMSEINKQWNRVVLDITTLVLKGINNHKSVEKIANFLQIRRTVTINSATRTATVTGLTNGTIYTFTVTATNVAGTSAVSNPIQLTPFTVPDAPTSNTFTVTATNAAGTSAVSTPIQLTPFTVPDAPSNLTGTASNAQVNLSWDAPTSNGGRDISNYNVISSPADRKLTKLYLINNGSIKIDIKKIAEALKTNETLTELYLRNTCFDTNDIAEVLKHNSTLTILDLSYSLICVKTIAKALKRNSTLTTLYLRGNKIKSDGMIEIAKALEINSTLTTLDLSYNNVGNKAAKAIATALKTNKTLSTLLLDNTSMHSNEVVAIATSLQINKTLTTLDIINNDIGYHGAKAIAEAVKINTTIQIITT